MAVESPPRKSPVVLITDQSSLRARKVQTYGTLPQASHSSVDSVTPALDSVQGEMTLQSDDQSHVCGLQQSSLNLAASETSSQPSDAATSERHSATLVSAGNTTEQGDETMNSMTRKSQWLILAVTSGACAAFNGVFAKLTTTELTTTWALGISRFFNLTTSSTLIEAGIRAFFFALNLVFNGIMWTLFTKALARSNSTVQVTVINTSSNFMITALLGLMIFGEGLSRQWFLGAMLLVIGNVIIGSREEKVSALDGAAEGLTANGRQTEVGEGAEDELRTRLLDDEQTEPEFQRQKEAEEDSLIDLDIRTIATARTGVQAS